MYTPALQNMKIAVNMLIFFSIITGVIYPAVVTLIGQLIFPYQANGSILKVDNTIVGSALLGQEFTDPKYFWGRPSVTEPMPYNALASKGSNLGPLNPKLQMDVKNRMSVLKLANPDAKHQITLDLVTSSASGLDPHISLRSAYYQVPRIARARNLSANVINQLIMHQINNNLLNIFNLKTVNVLHLNLTLDALAAHGNKL
jgi:K+-transporting ATPase ATPase C chain